MITLPDDSALAPGEALRPARIPGSKSITNRALLLAALAPGTSRLRGGLEAEDTRWMRAALKACGLEVEESEDAWTVHGGTRPEAWEPLWLGASGTSLRFLLPWLALQAREPVRLAGEPRLFERPLEPLLAPLRDLGVRWRPEADGGWLEPCAAPPESVDLAVDGRQSSQFITGLALATAGLAGGGRLRWTEVPASPSYLRMTAAWLARFGCDSALEEGAWTLPGGKLAPRDLQLPADWSGAAAFFAAAAVTGRTVELGPLEAEDGQGDRAILDILAAAGCTVAEAGEGRVRLAGPLRRGLDADLTDCPDLGPVLSAVAALAPGPSELRGLHTLPLKECDRLDASAELVRWLGGAAEPVGTEALKVRPGAALGERPAFGPRRDHRMAFAAAVGALRRPGTLEDPACVAKTFPDFWAQWDRLLGRVRG